MIIDGIFYKESEISSAPDLGSWRCGGEEKSSITGKFVREYYGNSSDTSKLPTVAQYPKYETILASGSVAICTDTGEALMYDEENDIWNQL